jgi:hypothetical protein
VLYTTIGLADLPRNKMTIKTAEMLGVYKKEERRAEIIRQAERNKQAKDE